MTSVLPSEDLENPQTQVPQKTILGEKISTVVWVALAVLVIGLIAALSGMSGGIQ